jgi:hypothetical protein
LRACSAAVAIDRADKVTVEQNLRTGQDRDEQLTGEEPGSDPGPSLADEVFDLVDDGKTYVEAELRYQKTRLAFAVDRSKSGIVFILGALAFIHLALIALVVGLVIALEPLVTIWGALAIVVGLLLAGAIVLALSAKGKFGKVVAAFRESSE